jgi:signal transduction histidine kinase
VLQSVARERADDREALRALQRDVAEARHELREFAHGMHPAGLSEHGLVPALERLAERSPVPVDLRGDVRWLPDPIEAALFFVCSEALANAAKHAAASRISVDVLHDAGRIVLQVTDDGVGGADPARGTGLRGLADRIHALGGHLRVESPAGAGTRLEVEIPLAA